MTFQNPGLGKGLLDANVGGNMVVEGFKKAIVGLEEVIDKAYETVWEQMPGMLKCCCGCCSPKTSIGCIFSCCSCMIPAEAKAVMDTINENEEKIQELNKKIENFGTE